MHDIFSPALKDKNMLLAFFSFFKEEHVIG